MWKFIKTQLVMVVVTFPAVFVGTMIIAGVGFLAAHRSRGSAFIGRIFGGGGGSAQAGG